MRAKREEAFLGYAIVSLTEKGPFPLTFRRWNKRMPNAVTKKELAASLFNESVGLSWYDERTHVPIVVRRSQLVVTSLVPAVPAKPEDLPTVEWSEEAAAKALPRFACGGNHRNILLTEKAEELRKSQAKLQDKLDNINLKKTSTSDANMKTKANLERQIEQLELEASTKTQWLAAFYDLGE